MYLTIPYKVYIIEDVSHDKTYVVFQITIYTVKD